MSDNTLSDRGPGVRSLQAELHQADPVLVDNAALLAAVFSASGDCIKILDLEGHLVFMSEGGKHVMEVDDFSRLKGCPWPDLWMDDGNISATAAVETARAGKVARFFGEANTAKGTPKFWDVRVLPILGVDGKPSHLLSISTDITQSKEAEFRQRLLAGELQHRIKNTLSLVSAIASQTLRGDDIAVRRDAFGGRIQALGHAHDILIERAWLGADVGAVVDAAVSVHQTAGRIHTSGPEVELKASQALSLALAIHELATNAAKYGALSNDLGVVDLFWTADGGTFTLTWQESGGPPVAKPAHQGFGSRVLNRVVAADFNGVVRIDYLPGGVVCMIEAPLADLNPTGSFSAVSQAGRAADPKVEPSAT